MWLATVVVVAIFTAMSSLGSDHPMIAVPMYLITWSITAVALVRFGLVVLAVGLFGMAVMTSIPYTPDFSTWYASTMLVALLSIIALAVWGFYTSLGGQRLWKGELLE